jgi:hypothetical protein
MLFDLLSGLITDDDIIDGTYILTQTAVPEGYEKSAAQWIVTVVEDDGELRVVLDRYRNMFENIWDWVIGDIAAESAENWTWDGQVLTVRCPKKTAAPPTIPPAANPPTGDAALTLLYLSAALSGTGLCTTFLRRKKK